MRDATDQNPQLGEEIRMVVEQQLAQPGFEAPNRAVERLMERGHTRAEAIDTIGAILLDEMREMMSEQEPFDRARYVERLEEL